MKVKVCSTSDVPENDMVRFEVDGSSDGAPILIARVKGQYYAISDLCSHAEASLAEGYLDAEALTVECPLHAAVFDLKSGEAMEFPAEEPVPAYTVTVEGEDLYVEIPE